MNQMQTKRPARKRRLHWLLGFALGVGVLIFVYIFLIPSPIELVIGSSLPDSAEVVHSQYDYFPMDPIHYFAISYSDDQARDQLISSLNLKTGSSNVMGSSTNTAPKWWPHSRLKAIEQNGECYGKIENNQWWSVWVDRENHLLYLESGVW